MTSVRMWEGNWGVYPIPERFLAVRLAKSGWPDLRFKAGREMAAHFTAIDRFAR